jgi:large subunit ribosomal protein L10
MTRTDKTAVIEELKTRFSEANNFYLADSSSLTVEEVNKFRSMCFEKGIEMKVVKNTLARIALEQMEEKEKYAELLEILKGPTAVLFTEVANAPAKVIKEFRGDNEIPRIKAAFIDTAIFVGDDKIKELAELKSKEELLGEIIVLLQSPAKNVISALKSGGSTLAGLVKALEERAEAGA